MLPIRSLPALTATVFALACTAAHGPVASDTTQLLADEADCAAAAERLGYRACLHRLATGDDYDAVTVDSSAVDQLTVGKYLVPAVDSARLPPVFLDVGAFPLHLDFLLTAFPDRFSGLSTSAYEQLVLHSQTREFYAGSYALYLDGDGFFHGFTVWEDATLSDDSLTLDQATAAWTLLADRFELGALAFVPSTSAQQASAGSWVDAPFEIKGLADVSYEAYNPGHAYGTLRLYTLDELAQATADSAYGYQDILVIEEAPTDIERVVSGIVTGTRQGGLSHLSVRSLARGTPNCFIDGALDATADHADRLVRLDCGKDSWSVEAASEADAQAWWDSIRPDPVSVCSPDVAAAELEGLLSLPTETADDRSAAVCRYGAKGANLATLYQRIDESYQFDGFLVPFQHYQDFITGNGWTVDLGTGKARHSFAETLEAWHDDAQFLADPTVRRARLEALRQAMQDAPVDADLVAELSARIEAVWGDSLTMVRFRSSSNAEDGLEFSGAGLYESESVCVADEQDADSSGPSLCDPDQDEERRLSDGLRTVWASLWKMAAWEERDWYGIDHGQVAMGVLVNDRSKDEQANAVAFTGNPSSQGDDRYLINAQEGELEVVSAEAGVFPESVLVTVEDGVVTEILRVSSSSEVDEVLTDAEVEALSDVLTVCAQAFPNDHDVPEDQDLLWDTEWKITSDGRLVVKQIRPFLR